MSAHNPTILELTSCPRDRAVSEIVSLLRGDDYLGELRSWPNEQQLQGTGGSIMFVPGYDIVVSVEFLPDPEDATRVRPAVGIDGRAYELVYDPIRGRTNRPAKRALAKLCTAVARAARPEAFRLRFVEPPAPALTVSALVDELKSTTTFPGLLFGISVDSPWWPTVRSLYPWKKDDSYQVMTLM